MDWGFTKSGFDVIWANEIDADASESYHRLIGNAPQIGDIDERIEDIPKAEVIIGGPPCQSFSLVGRRSNDDERGRLVFSFLEAVKRVRPRVFVMENVLGLMASKLDGCPLHECLQEEYSGLGYRVQIEKVVATDYLVPQKRRRVFMIGARDGAGEWMRPAEGVLSRALGMKGLANPVSASDALGDLPSPTSCQFDEELPYKTHPISAYAKLMRRKSGKTVSLQTVPRMSKLDREFVKHIPPGGNYSNIPDRISTKRIMKFKETGGRTTTYGRLHPDRPAYTINTYFNRPNVGANYHYQDERLITPREALRLQSFPDTFTPAFSSQRSLYRQIGNAVPPLLGLAIAVGAKELFDAGGKR